MMSMQCQFVKELRRYHIQTFKALVELFRNYYIDHLLIKRDPKSSRKDTPNYVDVLYNSNENYHIFVAWQLHFDVLILNFTLNTREVILCRLYGRYCIFYGKYTQKIFCGAFTVAKDSTRFSPLNTIAIFRYYLTVFVTLPHCIGWIWNGGFMI